MLGRVAATEDGDGEEALGRLAVVGLNSLITASPKAANVSGAAKSQNHA